MNGDGNVKEGSKPEDLDHTGKTSFDDDDDEGLSMTGAEKNAGLRESWRTIFCSVEFY
jgi:hypothetical protein